MMAAWIAVACAEHVRRGLAGGFMQVCHGKAGPLRRIRPGDGVAYYSPTVASDGKVPCRAFTAVGVVADAEPYQADMGGGFEPWRRRVAWHACDGAVAIIPLLPSLQFPGGSKNWGNKLRYGLLAVTAGDFGLVVAGMAALREPDGPAGRGYLVPRERRGSPDRRKNSFSGNSLALMRR